MSHLNRVDDRRDESRAHSIDSVLPCRVPFRRTDAQHSVDNIASWNTYLPTRCVRSMVSMGWDITT